MRKWGTEQGRATSEEPCSESRTQESSFIGFKVCLITGILLNCLPFQAPLATMFLSQSWSSCDNAQLIRSRKKSILMDKMRIYFYQLSQASLKFSYLFESFVWSEHFSNLNYNLMAEYCFMTSFKYHKFQDVLSVVDTTSKSRRMQIVMLAWSQSKVSLP